MIFVFGGAYSGKCEYVRNELGVRDITDYTAPRDELKKAKAIHDFHLYIKERMKSEDDVFEEVKNLIDENPEVVIISNEIGYGVVSIDKFEREYRETAGRISCYLAKRAKKAVRVVCGIGMRIK